MCFLDFFQVVKCLLNNGADVLGKRLDWRVIDMFDTYACVHMHAWGLRLILKTGVVVLGKPRFWRVIDIV